MGPKVELAEEKHYRQIQGGVPKVKEEGGLTIIVHDYDKGEGMVVKSHKTVKDYGTVVLSTSEGPRKFDVAKLRQFHGEPCETESFRAGGAGYDRKG